jgi:polyisoprenoid-binding protein YceI
LRFIRFVIAVIFAATICWGAAGEKRQIDFAHSQLIVRVDKSGFFSGFGHAHEISAPIVRGEVESAKPLSVWFDVNAAGMTVVGKGESDDTKAQVQQNMLGADVLDVAHFPQIHFASESVEAIGDNRWRVHGQLTLRGQTHPIVLETRLENGHYRGTATIQQTTFGITPIRVAGGTIKVKDEVQIEFDIVLAGK